VPRGLLAQDPRVLRRLGVPRPQRQVVSDSKRGLVSMRRLEQITRVPRRVKGFQLTERPVSAVRAGTSADGRFATLASDSGRGNGRSGSSISAISCCLPVGFTGWVTQTPINRIGPTFGHIFSGVARDEKRVICHKETFVIVAQGCPHGDNSAVLGGWPTLIALLKAPMISLLLTTAGHNSFPRVADFGRHRSEVAPFSRAARAGPRVYWAVSTVI